ncbi:MAG: threonylcarbamoyl-AMP synthase [Rhodoferax sp.]|nr:threonylcarbamoyl-AMP synthase [Rhodoferax sp.]
MIRPGSDPAAIAEAAQRIRAGELVGFPTETVYGLGADASNDAAVALIFAAKGRPSDHPLIVHVASAAQVADYASEVPDFAARLMAAFWPGPLTLILPRRDGVAAAAAGGQHSIGLRCPAHPVALALLQACGTGLAGPSANRFGRVSPTTAQHVQEELGEDLLVLDGGPCTVGIESTIVDCTRGQPVLLRPGVLTCAQLEAACGQPVLDKDARSAVAAPRASGMLESHYAPNARVRLMDAKGLQTGLDTLDSKAKGPAARTGTVAVYARSPLRMNTNILHKRMPEDAALAAQQLFAVLRELDATAVSEIWVQIPPDAPEWDGVRDRLNRAAADGSPPTRG